MSLAYYTNQQPFYLKLESILGDFLVVWQSFIVTKRGIDIRLHKGAAIKVYNFLRKINLNNWHGIFWKRKFSM